MIVGNYAEGLVRATRSEFDPNLWMMIAAKVNLGRMGDAHRLLAKLRKGASGHHDRKDRGRQDEEPSRFLAVADGLQIAGLEEG